MCICMGKENIFEVDRCVWRDEYFVRAVINSERLRLLSDIATYHYRVKSH